MAASHDEAGRTRSVRERLGSILSALGRAESISLTELGDVADHVARARGLDGWSSRRSRHASARRLAAGRVLSRRTRARWEALCEELESAIDLQERWLELLREARAASGPVSPEPDGNGPVIEAPAEANDHTLPEWSGERLAALLRRARPGPPFAVVRAALRLGLALAAALLLAVLVVRVHSSSLVYVLYVGASVVLSLVGWTTLVWMLYAWRKPDSLGNTRLAESGAEPAYTFSLIVPARHEEAVLQRTLERLVTTDHPEFEVLVVVGHDDPSTAAVADDVAARYPDVVKVIVDFSWPKNKPSALNTALPFCRGAITGVFDAEDDVHPALLRRIDQRFQQTEADVVQAGVQLMNFRSSWFAVRNVLEYYFWFRSRLHFHADKGFIPLGGNTVFIRTEVLRAVGGWDPECLAEDCELGVRLSSFGARTVVAYEPELVTREETPATLRAFVRQRTRWNQGFAQTFSRRYWRALPIGQRTLAAYTLATPFLMAFAWLMMPVAVATAILVKAPVPITLLSFLPTLPMLCVLGVELAGLGEFCRAYGERPRVGDYLRLILGLPFYQLILAFAAGRAIAREALGLRGWEKTAHLGLHLSAPEEDVSALLARRARASWRGETASERSSAAPPEKGFGAYEPIPTLAYALAAPLSSFVVAGPRAWPLSLVPRAGPAREPLWVRLGSLTTTGAAALSPPIGRVGTWLDPGSLARLAPRLARAVLSHLDAAIMIPLLAGVALVEGTNFLHWPAVQFDEGTYVGNAWAVAERGALSPYTYSYGHPPLGWITIAFWTWAGGLFGRSVYSIDAARELMLATSLVSCFLLFVLARRLGLNRIFAAGAVVLFALSPLSIFYHRAALLDNPAVAWTLAAFVLALSPKRRLWTFAGSGACFAASVLSKETTLVLLPALVLAAARGSRGATRRYCLTLFGSFFTLIGLAYPLYATLKGELLPGRGHVSLIGYTIVQLVTRKGTGNVFDPHSAAHAIVAAWLHLDPWLLGGAVVFLPLAACRPALRPIALAFLIQVALVLRPGYLPNMYVIGLLPFAALLAAGGCQEAIRLATAAGEPRTTAEGEPVRRSRLHRVSDAVRDGAPVVSAFALAVAIATIAFAVGPQWAAADQRAMTTRLDGPERAAQVWLVHHLGQRDRVIVDDDFWIYLVEHGFDAQAVGGGSTKGGFYSRTIVSFWPLDYDPAVKRRFPHGWRDFDYVVSTVSIRSTPMDQVPSTRQALGHSHVLAAFGRGNQRIEVRKIDVAGSLPVAPAPRAKPALAAPRPHAAVRPVSHVSRAGAHPAAPAPGSRAVPATAGRTAPRRQVRAAPERTTRAAPTRHARTAPQSKASAARPAGTASAHSKAPAAAARPARAGRPRSTRAHAVPRRQTSTPARRPHRATPKRPSIGSPFRGWRSGAPTWW